MQTPSPNNSSSSITQKGSTSKYFTPWRRVGLSRNYSKSSEKKLDSLVDENTPKRLSADTSCVRPPVLENVLNTEKFITIKKNVSKKLFERIVMPSNSPSESEKESIGTESISEHNHETNNFSSILETDKGNRSVENSAENGADSILVNIIEKTDLEQSQQVKLRDSHLIENVKLLCKKEKPDKRNRRKEYIGRNKSDSFAVSKPKSKQLRRCLTAINSTDFPDDDFEVNESDLKGSERCFVKLVKLKELAKQNHIQLQEAEISVVEQENENDLFTSTPKENVLKQIETLEKEVQERRQELNDLKRAESYKKLHNVAELKNLSARWKRGCTIALQDLLERLQEHSQMNMETLLKRLNIPQNFYQSSVDH